MDAATRASIERMVDAALDKATNGDMGAPQPTHHAAKPDAGERARATEMALRASNSGVINTRPQGGVVDGGKTAPSGPLLPNAMKGGR
jgi:hypothetical protein